ncbi:hypothetical protein VaNZ11_016798, partial [Volvox africanus]
LKKISSRRKGKYNCSTLLRASPSVKLSRREARWINGERTRLSKLPNQRFDCIWIVMATKGSVLGAVLQHCTRRRLLVVLCAERDQVQLCWPCGCGMQQHNMPQYHQGEFVEYDDPPDHNVDANAQLPGCSVPQRPNQLAHQLGDNGAQ